MNLGGYPAGVTDGSFDRPDAQPYCSQCGLLVDGDCHCGETEEAAMTDIVKRVLEAVRTIYGGTCGCACIKDMPGDNYTCSAHRLLREFAAQPTSEVVPCPNCAHNVEPLDWLYCPYCGEVLHPETLPPTEEK